MATHGGVDNKSGPGQPDPRDPLELVQEHYQRGSFSGLAFFLFPVIALYALLAAWFGWH